MVNWGACMVARSATCFRSPMYPASNYNNNEACSITVAAHEQVTLSVTAFDTAPSDYLVVDGGYYSGTTCYACCWMRGACSWQRRTFAPPVATVSATRRIEQSTRHSRKRWTRFGVWVAVRSSCLHPRCRTSVGEVSQTSPPICTCVMLLPPPPPRSTNAYAHGSSDVRAAIPAPGVSRSPQRCWLPSLAHFC